jgi:hypothetical protein
MRKPLVLLLLPLLLATALPAAVGAADPTAPLGQAGPAAVNRWESQEQHLYLEYPIDWQVAPDEPRGLMKNEIMSFRVTPGLTTSFLVAVYQLDAPVDRSNAETSATLYDQLNADVNAWVSRLPGGTMQGTSDISVDDVDGREFSYDYQQAGLLVHADMILLPKDGKIYEVTQWANDDEYDAQADTFDEIFSSLRFPWTPPA